MDNQIFDCARRLFFSNWKAEAPVRLLGVQASNFEVGAGSGQLDLLEPSRDARKKAFDEVQKILVDQEPIVYLVNPDYLVATSPALHGAQPSAAPPQILWNIEWLRLD